MSNSILFDWGKFLLFFAISSSFLCAQDGKIIMDGFGDTQKYNLYNIEAVNVSDDMQKFEIDTISKNIGGWQKIFGTKPGVLEDGKNYLVKFKYKTFCPDAEGRYPQFIVRQEKDGNILCDTNVYNEPMSPNGYRQMKIKLTGNSLNGETVFSINSVNGIKMAIKDFSIEEGFGERFLPADQTGDPYTNFGELPTGAKEFDVDLPNPEKEIVVNAADFGATEDSPSILGALNKALDHCKKIGASKLVLPRGTYKITEDGSINIDSFKDFTFDGCGSTLVYLKKKGANMSISNGLRVKVANLNFDWNWDADPLASVVEVVNIFNDGKNNGYVDFKFVEYDVFPRKDARMALISMYDPKTKSVGMEGSFDRGYEMPAGNKRNKTEWVADNIIRIHQNGLGAFKKGQMFRMQHYYYDMNCCVMYNNKHLTLQNINVWSCCGHAFTVAGQQKYWHFDNVNIVRPPNAKKRAITCTADHLHISHSQGFFKMENCEFSLGADDCINMHDCSLFMRSSGEYTMQTASSRNGIWTIRKGAKVEIRHGDYSPSGVFAKVEDIVPVQNKRNFYEVVFDTPIPKEKSDGFIIFNWEDYDTRNIIVRNCYFHDNRARGILILARDVTIENCRFYHNEMGAIKIETGYTFNLWSEGYGVENVVIRNNIFDTSNPFDMKNDGRARDIYMGIYMKTDPSLEQTMYPILNNILLEKNTFKDTFGLLAFIASTGNLTIRDNTFINETPRKKPFDYRGNFYVTHSTNTKIVNNTWIKSPNVPNPGVLVDRNTVKRLVFKGNKVADKIPLE